MKIKGVKGFFLVSIIVFFAFPLFATPSIPSFSAPVVDEAGCLTVSEKKQIDDYLKSVLKSSGVAIAVLTIPSLDGYPIEDYSMAVVEKWQLGSKEKDNGALLVISLQDRKLRIEVGYGLEGNLTDASSGLIIRNVIAPYFRDGEYAKGIVSGVQTMARTAIGNEVGYIDENLTGEVSSSSNSAPAAGFSAFTLFIFFIFMIIGVKSRSRKRGNGAYKRSSTGKFIKTMIIADILSDIVRLSSRGSISFGNDDSFGGFSGGGGFSSGGGFGGGGASGGW